MAAADPERGKTDGICHSSGGGRVGGGRSFNILRLNIFNINILISSLKIYIYFKLDFYMLDILQESQVKSIILFSTSHDRKCTSVV